MASDTALNGIQAAIYTALTADNALKAKAAVYDAVPESASFPYVQVGEAHEVPYNTFGKNGRDVRATLHIWDRLSATTSTGAIGTKTANSILGDCCRLLDFPAVPLTIAGWPTTPISVFEEASAAPDPDPLARHLVVRFRFYTEQ